MATIDTEWKFIIEDLKRSNSDAKVNYFPKCTSPIHIDLIIGMGYKVEESESENGYTIKVWK